MRLILASQSPRRAELLAAAGFAFDIAPAHVDESMHPGEEPASYVLRLAEDKARAVLRADDGGDSRIVLGADTVVVLDNDTLGKPADDADARRMLHVLSGRTHQVLTGVALCSTARCVTAVERTDVQFATLSDADIDWYVSSGEPRDKAGAYAIQGRASRYVLRIAGSYSNVVGLPVATVERLLREICGLR